MNNNIKNEKIEKCLDKLGYSIEKQLGSGGFGITYLVKDKNNSKDLYVIKTIKDEHFISEKKELINALKSIENELEKLKHLEKHPHIVTIYELLRESIDLNSLDNHTQSESPSEKLELPFLLMEYIEGEDLKKVVDNLTLPLEEKDALRYISQIGKALIYIHSSNEPLLHRDIKPQNIMVRKATNEAVLIDFGIARNFTPETTAYTVFGTENFSAPEQWKKKAKLGNYTDIYSLAATLYYLLTKQYPLAARDRDDTQTLQEPKEFNVNITDMTNKAIVWAMEIDFEKRPQTVKEWLEFLNPDKVKFDAEGLINSPDELKKAIITHFCPSELDGFLAGFNRNINYDDLDGKYLHEKVKSLIDQFPEYDDIEAFIEAMKREKPEAFT